MGQIPAIFVQTLRAAVRSRLVLSVLGLLVFTCAVLPFSIRGDGTVVSEILIVISYTLTAAAWLLAVTTVWASSGAVSHEVEGKQIRLLAVKPVNWHGVWAGKWLGVVALNTVFLALAAALLLLHVQRVLHGAPPRESAAVHTGTLTARLMIHPLEQVQDAAEAHRRAEQLKAAGLVPGDMTHKELLAIVARQIRAETARVLPGGSRSWSFELDGDIRNIDRVDLRYRMAPTALNRGKLPGRWELQVDGAGSAPVPILVTETRSGEGRLSVDPRHVAGRHRMIVTYVNPESPAGQTVVFHRGPPLSLLVGDGSFVINLLRALLIVLAVLSCLAALGVTAGTFFSFPVAAFASFAVLIIVSAAHFAAFSAGQPTGHSHGQECGECSERSPFSRMGTAALKAVDSITAPVAGIQPVGKLSRGVRISWQDTVRSLVTLGVFYPALIGAAGGWYLRRRELAAS